MQSNNDQEIINIIKNFDNYSTIFDVAPIAIVIAKDQRVEYTNPALKSMFAYGLQESLVGFNLFGFLAPEVRELIKQRYSNRKNGINEPTSYDTIGIRKDHSTFPIHADVNGFHLENEYIVIVFIQDITARKNAEAALIESEARYRTLVENAPESIVVYDVDAGHFIDVNQNALDLFQRTREELLNMGPIALYKPYTSDGTPVEEVIADRIARTLAGETIVAEIMVQDRKNPDHKEIPCELRMIQLPASDRRLIRGSFINIADRKKADEELENARDLLFRSQKMEALGQLAGGIAHDFNNALTLIKGYASLLLKDIPDVIPSHNYAQKILEASDNATVLTKQLLSISRRRVLQPTITNLNSIVRKVHVLLKRVIPSNIKLLLELDDSLKNVHIDAIQIEQVIINLVINSRDALPEGGEIIISTNNSIDPKHIAKFQKEINSEVEFVLLSIKDNGTGIHPDIVDRIFEPFFTTKDIGKGTGLGLAMAYGMITQSGGFVDVQSEKGEGTSFHILFPSVDAPITEFFINNFTQVEDISDKKKTILVVDDNDNLRHVVSEIIKRNGYNTLEANHPNEAIKICESYSRRIDMVLTDIVMPDLNGYELIHQIINIIPDLKVLFMTGYSEDLSIISKVQESGYRIIEKPFDDVYLLRLIGELLS
ncbi:MAG: PAS domain S-box protein [Candidatus Kariarchaeaceae archaeon]